MKSFKTLFIIATLSLVALFSCQQRAVDMKTHLKQSYAKAKEESGARSFIPTAKHIVDSLWAVSPEQVEVVVRQICEMFIDDRDTKAAAVVAAYPFGIDVGVDEVGEIGQRLLTQTMLPGTIAPEIDGLDYQPRSAIVLFYEATCNNCDAILSELTQKYDSLQRKGIGVITISGDSDRVLFEQSVEQYPWADNLCDFRSFAGDNFIRWGVASTPTLYSVDKLGIVRILDRDEI